ncbi:MAG: alcohol dehydrogenase catalytic domain-containing protein [Candidatus Aminicenantes bacterium]|nr:alcohol dehydrogenase catalytic domain-containing protein [Candidatus Aminicenantes bacterium]
MKAWILEKQAKMEGRPLKLVDVPTPQALDNEIRVKVLVCGVCRTDIHIAEGDLPLKKSPLILGHEIVGVVDETGKGVKKFKIGDRVGISWLHSTCGKCSHCLSGRENYCSDFQCTGWDADGGFAEYTTVGEDFALSLQGIDMEPEDIAPLLCPGIAGYCAFKLTKAKKRDRLGLYGFGPTAYCVLRVANHLGIDVYVSTRSPRHIEEAKINGAVWAADAMKEEMPCTLNSAIVFPPAGVLVEPALCHVKIGGIVVLAPVSMSTIEVKNYSKNFWGRDVRTLYNVIKTEGQEFLSIAGKTNIRMGRQVFFFEELNEAMILVKKGKIEEPNAIIKVADDWSLG